LAKIGNGKNVHKSLIFKTLKVALDY
jgi:hypothetical protein